MTIDWKAVEQYFTCGVAFVFQFQPACNFEEFINYGLSTVWSERVNYNLLINVYLRIR